MTSAQKLLKAIDHLTALEEYQFPRIDKTDPMSEILYERIVKARELIVDVLDGTDE